VSVTDFQRERERERGTLRMNSFLFWFHVVVVQICRFKICMRLLSEEVCLLVLPLERF
jgi:hypothetical protein